MQFDCSIEKGSNDTTDNNVTVELVRKQYNDNKDSTEKDMIYSKEYIKSQMIATGDMQKLSDTLSVNDANTIVTFGKDIAGELSRSSDEILRRYDMSMINQSSQMMSVLGRIMDKVDINEVMENPEKASKGIIAKIFKSASKKLDAFVNKYNNIGMEIEKVCVELRTYEKQIETSNRDLDTMIDNNIDNYKLLEKFILAGEYALEEITEYEKQLVTKDQTVDTQIQVQNVTQAKSLLEQRLNDLRASESIALQSIIISRSMKFGNLNLMRKINSAFIVTLPVFKNAIAQAVITKQQVLQTQALSELDKRTNEMLLKNAQNAASQMKITTQLAGSSSVKIETLENSWKTIIDGINETKAIQAELSKQREVDKKAIQKLNEQYMK